MNQHKKTLVAELTAALGPTLHARLGAAEALPKPVVKAVEQLADAVLRWRGRQEAATGTALAKRGLSDSDELARMMSTQLADGADADAAEHAFSAPTPPAASRPRRPRPA